MFVTLAVVVLSVAQLDADSQLVSEPQPTNLLLQFAGNKFDAWTISHRVDMPVGDTRAEVAPRPRRVAR